MSYTPPDHDSIEFDATASYTPPVSNAIEFEMAAVILSGGANITLGSMTLVATGVLAIVGTASVDLGAMTVSGEGSTPVHARLSQIPVEVLRTNLGVKARASQVVLEVIRLNTGTTIRSSQVVVEVLRPNADVAYTVRPVTFFCT